MARTDVPVTTITRAGVADPAPVNGDTVNNHSVQNPHGDMWLEVDNENAGPQNLTVKFARTVDGQAVASRVFALAAATVRRRLGPWPVNDYGRVLEVDVASTDIKLRAFRLGR